METQDHRIWTAVLVAAMVAILAAAQQFSTLVDFDKTNGSWPRAPLIQATEGNLYGTTFHGGSHRNSICYDLFHDYSCGTIFKISPTGTLTTLYDFCAQPNCSDGGAPFANVIQATDGNFYGTAWVGGDFGGGTVFKLTPEGRLITLHAFCAETDCADGSLPEAGLVQATNGNFYGTTNTGGTLTHECNGSEGCGTVFEITASGTLTTLYKFCALAGCADGEFPNGLVQGTDGNLYGTTGYGGANDEGTVFKITPAGTLTTLYSFCATSGCPDGRFPDDTLIQATTGTSTG